MSKNNNKGNWTAVIIVIIIAIILYYLFVAKSNPLTNPSILVSGTVTTSPLTTPASVIFSGSGRSYTAGVSNGAYSINLPGGISYQVTVVYSAAISSGSNNCNAGAVFIATAPSPYTYNPSC